MKKLVIVLFAAAIVGFAACKKEKKHTRKKEARIQATLDDKKIDDIRLIRKKDGPAPSMEAVVGRQELLNMEFHDGDPMRNFRRLNNSFEVRIARLGEHKGEKKHVGKTGIAFATDDRGTYKIVLDDGSILDVDQGDFERLEE